MIKIIYYIYLFVLGLMFWSFSSVIIHRIKSGKSWMFTWRSECPKCKNKLWVKDLFPIFSFLQTKGKCRYCKTKISMIYPILELVMWLIFVLTWYFLVDFNLIISLNIEEIIKLLFLLWIWFFTVVYVFYDILFLEIPESILLIMIWMVYLFLWVQTYFDLGFIPTITNSFELTKTEFSLIFAFWIALIWSLYIIMLKELSEIFDVLILAVFWVWFYFIWKYFDWNFLDISLINSLLWAYAFFVFFFVQILISKGKWMWGWDLRIAILIWLFVWISHLFYTVLTTYMIWSVIWIGIILFQYIKRKIVLHNSFFERLKVKIGLKKYNFNSQIPFWPFLAIGMYIMLFFQEYILKFFEKIIIQ